MLKNEMYITTGDDMCCQENVERMGHSDAEGGAVLGRVLRKGLSEQATSGGDLGAPADGSCQCKGPEAGAGLAGSGSRLGLCIQTSN